jgi:molybdopterin-guanine dinucleotide biosynthesis protein A
VIAKMPATGNSGITGAILAGGASRRYGGAPKGLSVVDGERIIDRIANAMRPLTDRLMVVSSHADAAQYLDDATVVADDRPGAGPLAAIATALRASGSRVLVVAWDMPFVDRAVLEPLVAPVAGYDATMWETESGIEPLCACYEQSALPLLDGALESGARRARDVAPLLALRRLPHLASSHGRNPFTSVNTTEALARVRTEFSATPIAAAADQRG